ncbi:hypothetical protein JTB14_032222 [Gonioctena quinquepunctata]|nr:hypothetical protein JTB14_032222 [Gonioctena quinquepunctata]
MLWGIEKESVARDLYISKTNKRVVATGLVIHPDYQYLGTSPDDDDGIIEIKCPFKVKDVHPENQKFDFLNRDCSEILLVTAIITKFKGLWKSQIVHGVI